jgi:hypothetical protein
VNLSPFQNILWIAETALTFVLFALVFARGLHRRLPLFGTYVALLVVETVAVHWTYHHWGYTSAAARYVYWSSLGVVLFARVLAVAELCWRSLRSSPAVWTITRRWLALLALGLLIYALIGAARNNSPAIAFLLTAERSLDFGIVVIVFVLLCLRRRYDVWLGGVERNVLFGFALYSTFQTVNDAFMQKWMMRYFHWWVSASVVSFEAALLIWIVPLLRPLPPPAPPPTLFSKEESVTLLTQILERMRRIAEEMKRIARSKWKRRPSRD